MVAPSAKQLESPSNRHPNQLPESLRLPLIARQMASAERGMHKAITALRRLQLDRGFVPSKCAHAEASPEIGFVSQNDPAADEAAFLGEPKTNARFVPQNLSEVHFVPSFLAEDVDESPFEILDRLSFSPAPIENAA
jgi:hypothetical protein